RALVSSRRGQPGPERWPAGSDIEIAARGNDRPSFKLERHSSGQRPAGHIHREGIGVLQLDVFLVLVAGGRIGLDGSEVYERAGWLRGRNFIGANGQQAIEQSEPSAREVEVFHFRDRVRERLRTTRGG